MPTESFPIAPTVLSVPLHSYGMLAYHPEISDLRSRREIAVVYTTAIFFFGSLASDFNF
jgi:hypothetical protein